MKKSYKVLIQIAYYAVCIMIVIGCYFFLGRFIPQPWPGIVSASAAFLMNETLGRQLLCRLWGIDPGSTLDFFRKK